MDMAAKTTREIIESGKLKAYLDPRLTKALRHPIREHLLACFNERITSATQIGEELGIDVAAFYKHVQILEELGFIEGVDPEEITIKRRRGNREHFFRAKETVLLDASTTQALPRSFRNDLLADQLMSIWDEAIQAIRAGTFDVDSESHVTWIPGLFDSTGWRDAIAILDHALYRLMEVQRESAERVAKSGERGFTATFAMLGFGTSPSRPTDS